jgi:predicted dehydrogenase
MRYEGGPVASLHASWTQWKNLFSFEVFGTAGSLTVEGLGGSYGTERLTIAKRNPDGGLPGIEEIAFEGDDRSWELEWQDFMGAVLDGKPYWGTPADGLAVMEILAALYASAESGKPVAL